MSKALDNQNALDRIINQGDTFTFTADELHKIIYTAYLDGNTDGYFGSNEKNPYESMDVFFTNHPELRP